MCLVASPFNYCGWSGPRQVVAETEAASQNVGTLGVALTTCTLPGQEPSSRLNADTIEVWGGEKRSSEGASTYRYRSSTTFVELLGVF